jgi:hypothetical protein
VQFVALEPKWRVKGDELHTGYQKTW